MHFFRHLRNYTSAGLVSALVGLVSFPLLTRNLTVAEYGIVGLVTASVTLFMAIGKLGLQHAVIRYYAQIKNSNMAFSLHQFNSTVSATFLFLALLTAVVFLLCGWYVLPVFSSYEGISELFSLATLVLFVRLLGSGAINGSCVRSSAVLRLRLP